MKQIKKVMALLLALAMVMGSMSLTAFAADDGSIVVTNATAGQEYNAYLIFTAKPSNPDDLTKGVSYTATATQVAVTGFDDVFDKIKDKNGNYTITKKSGVSDDAVVTFIKNNIDSLKQGSAIEGEFTDNDTVKFENLAYGYYYITSALGTVVTIDTAGKTVQVVDKNATNPEGPEKIITAEDSSINSALDQTGKELTENDAAVGSVESFEVDFNATNWVKNDDAQTAGSGTPGTKVLKYNFTDKPTGLAIDASSVKVTVNGSTDVTATIDDIVVSDDGVLTFTIPWVDNNGKHLYETKEAGSELIPVKVTYNATVTDAAATAIAPNEVEVKYNDNVSLGKDTTTTYTYKFNLLKLDENKAPLDGAEFQLFYASSGTTAVGDALKFKMDDNGVYHYDPEGTVTNIKPTGDDAKALVVGLDNANYVLKEVVVPEGYNPAADTAVSGLSKVNVADEEATKIKIENKKGTELPSTGGMGTTIFYILGAGLVIGAVVMLVARKKAEKKAE